MLSDCDTVSAEPLANRARSDSPVANGIV